MMISPMAVKALQHLLPQYVQWAGDKSSRTTQSHAVNKRCSQPGPSSPTTTCQVAQVLGASEHGAGPVRVHSGRVYMTKHCLQAWLAWR